MQDITIQKTVEIPNCPRFVEGQKVRVADPIADALVKGKFAKYDSDKPAKTEKAKKATKEYKEESEKEEKDAKKDK